MLPWCRWWSPRSSRTAGGAGNLCSKVVGMGGSWVHVPRTQLPVQQSLSVWQEFPRPASWKFGTQALQAGATEQSCGQCRSPQLEVPVLESRAAARPRVVASAGAVGSATCREQDGNQRGEERVLET